MKYSEAMVAYNPVWRHSEGGGEIRVGPWPERDDWSRPYRFTVGACITSTRELRGAELVAQVFIDFHHAVVRDGIDPLNAHEAFLSIGEYREHLSEDCINLRPRI